MFADIHLYQINYSQKGLSLVTASILARLSQPAWMMIPVPVPMQCRDINRNEFCRGVEPGAL